MNRKQGQGIRSLAKVSVLTTTVLLAVPAVAGPAQAGDDDREVRASSKCLTGVVKVKAKRDDGKIEIEGEVDTNRVGQKWSWTMRRDGRKVAEGVGRTAGASGSFSVERKVHNPVGSEIIKFRAVKSTGQVCSVSVNFRG